ncbi:hypothetical protein GLX30_01135 [Streptomyces sp. Tu 2975]|nr:hypothetical protein GLX30_01135 [Streptomyces sp. Tu 2975]
MTPLHFAAQARAATAAAIILAAGASMDVGDGNGNTALFTAVHTYRGDPGTHQVPLQAGADPEQHNARASARTVLPT